MIRQTFLVFLSKLLTPQNNNYYLDYVSMTHFELDGDDSQEDLCSGGPLFWPLCQLQ